MRLSIIAARSENNVIGSGSTIPWKVKGEQLLFKAMTYNHWILIGRKTFESMGRLPNRKYAVISRSMKDPCEEGVSIFRSVDNSLEYLSKKTLDVFVSGGGQIYKELIAYADNIHISTIHCEVEGDIFFPPIPKEFKCAFSQQFESNINYTYEIYTKS
jgi:dihydrofolate reductase (trimethoprim resistance protein)